MGLDRRDAPRESRFAESDSDVGLRLALSLLHARVATTGSVGAATPRRAGALPRYFLHTGTQES